MTRFRDGSTSALMCWLLALAAVVAVGAANLPEETGSKDDAAAFFAAQRRGPEHEQLARLAGDFVLTTRFWADSTTADGDAEVSRMAARRELLLDGRVLRLQVGSSEAGGPGSFGQGLMGFDRSTGEHWYVWTDVTTTGVEIYRGRLTEDGSGRLAGGRETPAGREAVRVEIRRHGTAELHDYYAQDASGKPWRFLELRYVPL